MKQPVKIPPVSGMDSLSIARTSIRVDVSDGPQTPALDRSGAQPVTLRITVAEERVVRWVSRGMTNKEIAAVLGISPATVKRHLEKILTKLAMRNRVELAIYGLTASCPHQGISGCALRQAQTAMVNR